MVVKNLIIEDRGDPSVGIFPQYWEINIPFYVPDSDNIDSSDQEELDRFKADMSNIYQDYCEGRLVAIYDYELRRMND